MIADDISSKLGTQVLGRQIYSYEETGSTNEAVFHLGEEGLPEGLCVFAEHQKKGRGRLGRSWVCPKGQGILFSILLRPLLPPSEISKITLMTAVSVVKTIESVLGKKLGIKWPNDIVYKEKKVCGILTEMDAELDRVHFVVVGIGINVNTQPKDLPPGATSLRKILRKKILRIPLAQALLRQMEKDYARLSEGRFKQIAEDWEHYSVTSGRRVAATLLNRKVHGQAVGIDLDGALWIRKDNGLQERILAGDVQHLR